LSVNSAGRRVKAKRQVARLVEAQIGRALGVVHPRGDRKYAQSSEGTGDSGGSEARHRSVEVPPPRVFCKKRLDLLDSKGVDIFGDDKEAARA
jgi:hypothetical protein